MIFFLWLMISHSAQIKRKVKEEGFKKITCVSVCMFIWDLKKKTMIFAKVKKKRLDFGMSVIWDTFINKGSFYDFQLPTSLSKLLGIGWWLSIHNLKSRIKQNIINYHSAYFNTNVLTCTSVFSLKECLISPNEIFSYCWCSIFPSFILLLL